MLARGSDMALRRSNHLALSIGTVAYRWRQFVVIGWVLVVQRVSDATGPLLYEIGEICPRRVTTKLNTSDVLTKANPKPDLDRLVPVLTGQGGELPPIPDLPRD